MQLDHLDNVALWRSGWRKAAVVFGLAVYLLAPFVLSDFQLSIVDYAGIAAIGAIGLNVLTGYTGQISLGHGFFLGAGAYTAAYVGGELELPLPVWLVASAAVGALVGLVIGPFALRLAGQLSGDHHARLGLHRSAHLRELGQCHRWPQRLDRGRPGVARTDRLRRARHRRSDLGPVRAATST